MTAADRIRDLIEQRGITVRELSRRIGVSHVTISKWTRNVTKPTGENLERFCEFFEVTPGFVLFGEPGIEGRQTINIDADEIAIPVIDVDASCGYGSLSPSVRLVRMFRATRAWLAARLMASANLNALHIVTADGDSMAPGIQSGDFAFVDSSQTSINADALYAVQYSGSIFIKRVMTRADGGVVLISDNPRYPAQPVDDPSRLKVVGRVVLVFNVREP